MSAVPHDSDRHHVGATVMVDRRQPRCVTVGSWGHLPLAGDCSRCLCQLAVEDLTNAVPFDRRRSVAVEVACCDRHTDINR